MGEWRFEAFSDREFELDSSSDRWHCGCYDYGVSKNSRVRNQLIKKDPHTILCFAWCAEEQRISMD